MANQEKGKVNKNKQKKSKKMVDAGKLSWITRRKNQKAHARKRKPKQPKIVVSAKSKKTLKQ